MQPEDFLVRIRTSFSSGLPGVEAHRLMMPANRPLTAADIANVSEYRNSAVAIICYPDGHQLKCVLIQRPDYEGTHGGQMSFPGGKEDPIDVTLEATARREAWEEIGWDLVQAELLGQLTPMYIPVSRFIVHPFLYYTEAPQPFLPDEREVAEVVVFQLDEFLNPTIVKQDAIRLSNGMTLKNVPYFELQGKRVWGATAIILSEFREMLLKNG